MGNLEQRIKRIEDHLGTRAADGNAGCGITFVWRHEDGHTLAQLADASQVRLPDNWQESGSLERWDGPGIKVIVGVNPDVLRGDVEREAVRDNEIPDGMGIKVIRGVNPRVL